MKLKWKIVAAVVAAIVLIAAAIPLFVNVNTFKPAIESQLTTALGRQTKVGGLSLSILSGSITARDFVIADDPHFSSQPALTAKELRLGVQVMPLLFHRQILVTSLEIDTPQIHLVHAANGVWNFSSIGQTAANRTEQQKQQSIIPDFTVGSFRIKNGHAELENLPAAGAAQVVAAQVIDQIDLSVDDFAFAKQFPFTLTATFPGDATMKVTGKAGPINPQNAAKTAFDAQLTLHHFDPVAAGFVDKSAGIAVLADIDAHAISNGASVTSTGTLHTQHLQLRPDAVPAPKPIDITYNATHSLSDNTGQLQDAAFQTGKLAAHVNGTYSLQPGNNTVDLKLAGEQLPIDELQSLLPAVGVKLPNGSVLQGGTLTTHLTITGPLQALVISGPVELANTRLSGFNPSSQLKGMVAAATGNTGNITNIQALRVQLQVAKDGIRANNLFLSMPSIGDAVGSGTVSPAGALNFKLKLKVDTSRGVGGTAVGLLSMMNGTVGKTASEAASTGLPVTITGTSSKPIITPDVSGMVKSNGQQLTNTLTGLFGRGKK
ncbi:MAG TPA: AsmA family protein [Edaphobacter sp.]|nr:AsmA family protein [Edaphobacter sp.]